VRSLLKTVMTYDLLNEFSYSGLGKLRKRTKISFKDHQMHAVMLSKCLMFCEVFRDNVVNISMTCYFISILQGSFWNLFTVTLHGLR